MCPSLILCFTDIRRKLKRGEGVNYEILYCQHLFSLNIFHLTVLKPPTLSGMIFCKCGEKQRFVQSRESKNPERWLSPFFGREKTMKKRSLQLDGYNLHLPTIQDSSHYQDDYTFRIGNPNY